MKNIHNMINKIIIEITFMVVLCVVSSVVFSYCKLEGVQDNFVYTDINVIETRDTIGINHFTDESQVKLTVSNLSNTKEKYNVLLTSDMNLSNYEDILKVKVNDKEYLLKDLKVADNYFLIDEGNMKANTKEIDLYFAIDELYSEQLQELISFESVNDISI